MDTLFEIYYRDGIVTDVPLSFNTGTNEPMTEEEAREYLREQERMKKSKAGN